MVAISLRKENVMATTVPSPNYRKRPLLKATRLLVATPIHLPPVTPLVATPPPVGTYVPTAKPAKPDQAARLFRELAKLHPAAKALILLSAVVCFFGMIFAVMDTLQTRGFFQTRGRIQGQIFQESESQKKSWKTKYAEHDKWITQEQAEKQAEVARADAAETEKAREYLQQRILQDNEQSRK